MIYIFIKFESVWHELSSFRHEIIYIFIYLMCGICAKSPLIITGGKIILDYSFFLPIQVYAINAIFRHDAA